MKKLIGRKSVLMCLVGMMVILLGATAQAALISGSISFGAAVAPTLTPPGSDYSTNKGFAWPVGESNYWNATVLKISDGDFTAFEDQDAHFFNFSFDSLSGTSGETGYKLWELDAQQYFAMNFVTVATNPR